MEVHPHSDGMEQNRVLSSQFQAETHEQVILDIISEIRYLVESSLDNSVSDAMIRALPMEYRSMRNIRNFLSLDKIQGDAVYLIQTGITELERLIQSIQTCFLPRGKELLSVSPLKPASICRDRELHILRKLALYALPNNLESIQILVRQLKSILALLAAA